MSAFVDTGSEPFSLPMPFRHRTVSRCPLRGGILLIDAGEICQRIICPMHNQLRELRDLHGVQRGPFNSSLPALNIEIERRSDRSHAQRRVSEYFRTLVNDFSFLIVVTRGRIDTGVVAEEIESV